MLSVDEALQIVLKQAEPLPPAPTKLLDARGRVLAEPIVSDIDSPPHDKSIVDGYAVIADSLVDRDAELTVLEEVTAGACPTQSVRPGTTTRIMTGAPLPPGADAVVMVEQTRLAASGKVQILQSPVRSGQNIMRRAAAMGRGQVVLAGGQCLRAIELGLLAEVGRHQVKAVSIPSVAVIATGNELVEAAAVPATGQIRNSNGPLLVGLVEQAGGTPVNLGIARDNADDLRAKITVALSHNVVVLSGGVSAGVLDLVPQVLADLGALQVFHKVNLKPGKPLWFGTKRGASGDGQTLVFGLPGNPVSTLVCFELFVRPALQKLRGAAPTGLPRIKARLAREHQQRGDRPTYWPAQTQSAGIVTLLNWKGSGDLRTLADANCLAFFPSGERLFAAGEEIECLRLPGSDA
jgi:molybdopterin molybdotransferase